MKVAIRVNAPRPELADVLLSEMFTELDSVPGLVSEPRDDAWPTQRLSRMGGLEFVVAMASSAAVVKLVEVLLAYVNRRSVEIEVEKQDGTKMKIAARADGTEAAKEIVAFLTAGKPVQTPSEELRRTDSTSNPPQLGEGGRSSLPPTRSEGNDAS